MKLLAAGCSFVFGDELSDQHEAHTSNSTFTALLAKDLGLEYQCVAVPGSGSDSHVREVVKNVDHETALVVVAWSYAGRFEFNFDNLGWASIRDIHTRPKWIREIVEPLHYQFYSNLTQCYQWYHYVKDIVFLQEWLKAKHVPYLFCNIDPGFNKNSSSDESFQILYKNIDWSNWFFWKLDNQNKGFRQWCIDMQNIDSKFEIGPLDHHPLEHAHTISFDLIKQDLIQKDLYETYRISNY